MTDTSISGNAKMVEAAPVHTKDGEIYPWLKAT